jgi:hypothetical protein
MNISLKTDINGYFSYRVYKEVPENIIYQSPIQKNLIVDSGLEYLYTKSITEVMQLLDLGNSSTPASPSDTGIIGTRFSYSNIFNDLLALSTTNVFVPETSISEYTTFFRTKTTSTPIILQEFVIKPGVNQKAFARQIFSPINLGPGEGLEFTYKVQVTWPCDASESTTKLIYDRRDINATRSSQELPLNWTSSPSGSNLGIKKWTKIYSDKNNTLVAIASGSKPEDPAPSNILVSRDNGVNWLSAYSAENTLIVDPLLGITSGILPIFTAPKDNNTLFITVSTPSLSGTYYPVLESETRQFISRFVAVGPRNVTYYSDTTGAWVSGSISGSEVDWRDVEFGKIYEGNTAPLSLTASYVPTFVAVGSGAGAYSTDGIAWIRSADPILTSTHIDLSASKSNWSSIVYGKQFVTVSDSGSGRIAYSSDGKNWLSARPPALNEWSDLAYDNINDIYVAVSRNYAGYSPIMYASGNDLSRWYPVQNSIVGSWESVTCQNGVFIAAGSTVTEYDFYYPLPIPPSDRRSPQIMTEDRLVDGLSARGAILYSTNGIEWQTINSPAIPLIPWKSVDFINNTFVAAADIVAPKVITSSTAVPREFFVTDYPFIGATVLPKSVGYVDVDTKVSLFSVPPENRIIKDTYPMYTLRSLDMPDHCLSAAVAFDNLLYSTTLSTNSYAIPTSTLIYPNTAVLTYSFGSNTGYGSIKNLLITNEVFNSTSTLSGIWGIELNTDSVVFDNPVTTGEINNPVSSIPTAGSITRNLKDNQNVEIVDSQLTFNVYQVWGTDRSSYNTTNEERSFVLFDAPSGWKVYDASTYLSKRTSDDILYSAINGLSSIIGLYKDIPFTRITANIGCLSGDITIIDYHDFNISIKTNKFNSTINKTLSTTYNTISQAFIRLIPSRSSYSILNIFNNSDPGRPGEISFLNSILITPSMLLNLFNDSSIKTIGNPIIEDVVLLPQENKIKLYFKENISIQPDHILSTAHRLKSVGMCGVSGINYQYVPTNTIYNVSNKIS